MIERNSKYIRQSSLGLPINRVSNQNSKLVFLSNAKQRYTGIFCQCTVHLTKNQLLRAYWRHNKTKRGIQILSRYTSFWQKYDVLIFKTPNNGISLISRQFTVHSTITKPRGRYRYTVYCHGIPLYGKKYVKVFHFVLVLEDVFSF